MNDEVMVYMMETGVVLTHVIRQLTPDGLLHLTEGGG